MILRRLAWCRTETTIRLWSTPLYRSGAFLCLLVPYIVTNWTQTWSHSLPAVCSALWLTLVRKRPSVLPRGGKTGLAKADSAKSKDKRPLQCSSENPQSHCCERWVFCLFLSSYRAMLCKCRISVTRDCTGNDGSKKWCDCDKRWRDSRRSELSTRNRLTTTISTSRRVWITCPARASTLFLFSPNLCQKTFTHWSFCPLITVPYFAESTCVNV